MPKMELQWRPRVVQMCEENLALVRCLSGNGGFLPWKPQNQDPKTWFGSIDEFRRYDFTGG